MKTVQTVAEVIAREQPKAHIGSFETCFLCVEVCVRCSR